MWSKISMAVLGLFLAASAHAQSGIRLGVPSYGGPGCPGGSASITLSPSEDALSILFDSFIVEAGGVTGRMFDRKSCNITIPVQVPQGYSLAIFTVDYRGFNGAPAGGMTRLSSEYFWAGVRGPRVTRTMAGGAPQNFTVTDQLLASTLVWTPCGASVNLRVNTDMFVQSNRRYDQAMSSVDSVDLTSGLIYHFQWRRCN